MSQVSLIATKAQRHGFRKLQAGEEFTASTPMARALIALGRASMSDAPAAAIQAVPEAEAVDTDAPDRPKRAYVRSGKYARRDMRPDE